MKKVLSLVVVFSLALVLSNVSFADDAVVATAQEQAVAVEGVAVEGIQDGCGPVLSYHSCLFRPFVRRACTPCVANPCSPCPSYVAPQPVCTSAPLPRKLCGAPLYNPCYAEPVGVASSCADPCGYEGYGREHFPRLRGLLSRLFSGLHGSYYDYDGYGYGYGPAGCPCQQQLQPQVQLQVEPQ